MERFGLIAAKDRQWCYWRHTKIPKLVASLSECGVMTAEESAVMIDYCVQIIDGRKVWILVCPDIERTHIEALDGIIDFGVEFLSPEDVFEAESLQLNDQEVGQSPQSDLFCRFPRLFAFGTIPWVVCRQLLRLSMQLETVFEIDVIRGVVESQVIGLSIDAELCLNSNVVFSKVLRINPIHCYIVVLNLQCLVESIGFVIVFLRFN